MVWAGPVDTSKLFDFPHSHIKGTSVLKVGWADMPYVCWENTLLRAVLCSVIKYAKKFRLFWLLGLHETVSVSREA